MKRYELINVKDTGRRWKDKGLKCQHVKDNGKRCDNLMRCYATLKDNKTDEIFIVGHTCLENLAGITTEQVKRFQHFIEKAKEQREAVYKAEEEKAKEIARTILVREREEDRLRRVEENAIAEISLKKATLGLSKYKDYDTLSFRVLYNTVDRGVGFMNETHRKLYHNTLVEKMFKRKKFTDRQEELMKVKSYIYATDTIEKNPDYEYNEELTFYTKNKKITGKPI